MKFQRQLLNFINTPLQRGAATAHGRQNRFNGFCKAEETVKTVVGSSTARATLLKQGVNGIGALHDLLGYGKPAKSVQGHFSFALRLACLALALGLASFPMPAAKAPVASAPLAVELKGGETPAQLLEIYTQALNAVLPDLAKGDAKALDRLEAIAHGAARPGAEPERAACAQALAGLLSGDGSPETKTWVLRQLQNLGRAEVVPSLAKLLDDKDAWLKESARTALQNNPVPEAATALREALAKATEPAWQGALALALGARKDAASVKAIAALLPNAGAQEAAVRALGDIGTEEAAQAIAGARRSLPEKLKVLSAESWMKCAEQMIRDGRPAAAAAIYEQLDKLGEPHPVRLAALRGKLQAAGDKAGGMILELLGGADADARSVATAEIYALGAGAINGLVAGAPKLPAESQALVIGILAARDEKAALPLATAMARQPEAAARTAGLEALGRLGDASTVPLLLEVMQGGADGAAEARASLARLSAPGVNENLLAALKKATDPRQKTALIEVLDARGAAMAAPALLSEAAGADAGVKRSALRALGKLGSASDLPAVLKILQSSTGGERDEAERAAAAISARVPEKEQPAAAALAAYQSADEAGKVALLPLLGRIGGAQAFEVIKTALAGGNKALVEAASKALYNWPEATDTVADELLAMVNKTANPKERSVALRAYIRVATMPDGFPDKVRLERLQKAMTLAAQDQERNLVLERAVDIKRIETVRFVAAYLDHPALAARAGNTICELAKDKGVRAAGKGEVEKWLAKIVETSKDQNLADRAKRRLADK